MPTLTVQFSIGTAIPSEINPDDAGNAGTSSLAAKEDHVHGFPCGTPGTTTLGEASAEGDAASAARSDHKHNFIRTGLADVRLTRSSAMQLSLGGLVGTSKRIEINGEYLDCSTTETVNTTDNVIAADSTDSGAAAAADTNYYVYASNSQASYAPSSIRLCTQAPDANGYLGSGNAAHWRLVGWAGTDSSTQFPENGFVISRFNMKSDRIMSTFSPPGSWYYPSTAYTWEDIGVSESFLWPPGMAVFIYFNATTFHQEAGCMNAVRIRLDQKGEASAGAFLSEAYVNARVNHVGGHYSRNTGALVRETLYVQAYTTKVTPTNGAFYKANDFTNFIVIFIPEELT